MNQVVKSENGNGKKSIITTMATRYGMEPGPFEKALRSTVVPDKCSNEQFAAFLLVAYEYQLNPVIKEIYCFPKQGGGIIPVVSVDGWVNLIQSNKNMDGLEFEDDVTDEGELLSITCRIWRKDRSKPVMVTEYMEECKRNTDPWKQWPRRMLRHKAMIQAARYAFGFSGIYDQDEAERIAYSDLPVKNITPQKPTEVDEFSASEEELQDTVEIVNPEDILKAIDNALAAALDVGALNAIQETTVVPMMAKLKFPSDKDQADALFDKHFKRVSQK